MLPTIGLRWCFGLGAWLFLSTGCAPAAATAPPASAAIGSATRSGQDTAAPGANVVSTVEDPNEVPLSSTIRKVTVYSDRALISRQGAVKLAAAPTVYAFRKLPGWVDEASVRAATSAGNIVDVRVVRGYLARATDPRFVRAEACSPSATCAAEARRGASGKRTERASTR